MSNEKIGVLKLLLGHEKPDRMSEREWSNLYDHIEMHKNFMHESKKALTWQDAFHSWYKEVYSPVRNIIRKSWYSNALPHGNSFRQCLGLSNHWQYMKMFTPNISAESASKTYIARYGSGCTAGIVRAYLLIRSGFKVKLLQGD